MAKPKEAASAAAAEATRDLLDLSLPLADETLLMLGDEYDKPLTLTHWQTLRMLVGCGSLPRLVRLTIDTDDNGDEGVASLADGLRRGRLPSLFTLGLFNTQIGPQGATALASAATFDATTAIKRRHFPQHQNCFNCIK